MKGASGQSIHGAVGHVGNRVEPTNSLTDRFRSLQGRGRGEAMSSNTAARGHQRTASRRRCMLTTWNARSGSTGKCSVSDPLMKTVREPPFRNPIHVFARSDPRAPGLAPLSQGRVHNDERPSGRHDPAARRPRGTPSRVCDQRAPTSPAGASDWPRMTCKSRAKQPGRGVG